jgi:hypothetical protein
LRRVRTISYERRSRQNEGGSESSKPEGERSEKETTARKGRNKRKITGGAAKTDPVGRRRQRKRGRRENGKRWK